jgi:radical SAM superfamily enzyme YgiQ (UPF0313 family)
MRYEEPVFRPPSEADSYILQATIGCSWNACTYCDLYRRKRYRVRELEETLADVETARAIHGDALGMDLSHWEAVLSACKTAFPRLRRVSAYATAINLLAKTPGELRRLRALGLTLLYIGPESGDDATLKAIAKGAGFEDHVAAARLARDAGIKLSAIFLLGAGGIERSGEHAIGSARLATAMDPRFVSLLTLTVIPGTPLAKLEAAGRFTLPTIEGLLGELRIFVSEASPSDAIFRTNHASNYLPLSGRLPRDRDRLLELLDAALDGRIPLRPERARGL